MLFSAISEITGDRTVVVSELSKYFDEFYLKRTNRIKQTKSRYNSVIDEAETKCITRCLHRSMFIITSFSLDPASTTFCASAQAHLHTCDCVSCNNSPLHKSPWAWNHLRAMWLLLQPLYFLWRVLTSVISFNPLSPTSLTPKPSYSCYLW